MNKENVVKDILKQHNITSWYQPIINIESRELLGWEAFSRGLETKQGLATPAMFDTAAAAGILKPFDLMCLHNAATCFEQLQLSQKLFINFSNEMLIASSRLKKQVGKMIANSAIPPTRMVLEIDETSGRNNVDELKEAVSYFHQQGFEVALDHLSSMGKLSEDKELYTLWEELNPDYIKLDRRFIEHIYGSSAKQKAVKELVAIARSLGAIIIAEGVETEKELKKLYELGIYNVQGYLIQGPELAPLPPDIDKLLSHELFKKTNQASLACDLVVTKSNVQATTTIMEVFEVFEQNVHINSIAVLQDQVVQGMIFRQPFLSKFSKKQRREVVQGKPVTSIMSSNFLKVDSHQRIEQVSRLVTSRAQINAEYDFVIESEGRFLGIGTVIDLLRKITQLRVRPDHQENLLTMLPGATPIGACVDDMLDRGAPFSVVLLDLSNFKVFNNYYGHTVGDQVLIMFSEILRRQIKQGSNFAGHIGGDDFILVSAGEDWQSLLISIFIEFKSKILKFYTEKDIERGGVEVTDLDGNKRLINFISLSAGVLSIRDEYFEGFEQILTRLIKLKPLTKNEQGVCLAHQFEQIITRYSYTDDMLVLEE